jgi:hypothetical protein
MKKLLLIASLLVMVGAVVAMVARRRGVEPQAAWKDLTDTAKGAASQVSSTVKDAAVAAKDKVG